VPQTTQQEINGIECQIEKNNYMVHVNLFLQVTTQLQPNELHIIYWTYCMSCLFN